MTNDYPSFASPLHLPFNRQSLARNFTLSPPDAVPTGEGVWVLRQGASILLAEKNGAFSLPQGDLPPPISGMNRPELPIGLWQGTPCRALSLPSELTIPGLTPVNLLADPPQIAPALLSLGGVAGQILHWQRGSTFCSHCAAPTVPLAHEWGKRCSGCGHLHFPSIHPCIIVLVRRGRELLLTRKEGWPENRYSLVAGFVDFGEALEETVVREVKEETGIEVTAPRYIGSQSWPFPSQIMAGFVADYAGGELVVDHHELEDARWFDRDTLPNLPPRRSIARYLIDKALQQR